MAGGFIDDDDDDPTAEGKATKRCRSRRRSISSRSFPDAIVRLYACRIYTCVHLWYTLCTSDGVEWIRRRRRQFPANESVECVCARRRGENAIFYLLESFYPVFLPSPSPPGSIPLAVSKALPAHESEQKTNAPVTGLYLTTTLRGRFWEGRWIATVFDLTVERNPVTNVTLKHATYIRYLNPFPRTTASGKSSGSSNIYRTCLLGSFVGRATNVTIQSSLHADKWREIKSTEYCPLKRYENFCL